MTEDEEVGDNATKTSRRDRLKGAFAKAKTKAKFRKRDDDYEDDGPGGHNEEIDDFLSAGRVSSSSRPSFSDSLSFASDRPSTADSLPQYPSPRPSTSDRLPGTIQSPSQPQRRVVVPRIDVSNSQRWPGASPVLLHDFSRNNQLLRADSHSRSRSVSSLSKGTGRARGLSVTFIEAPPVIIGEGGDKAQAPPMEISRARARARSVSPLPTQPLFPEADVSGKMAPVRRKPVPEPLRLAQYEQFQPRVFQRTPTGFSTPPPEQKRAMDTEFDMSMGMAPNIPGSNHPSGQASYPPFPTTIVSPKPVHPPVSMPPVPDMMPPQASPSLRSRFEADIASRMGRAQVIPNSIPDNQVYYPPPAEPGRHPPPFGNQHEPVPPPALNNQSLSTPYKPDGNWI